MIDLDVTAPARTDRYRRFHEEFSMERYHRFTGSMERIIGHRYPLSTTPYLLPRERFEGLVEVTRAILRMLRSDEFQRLMADTPWFLPHRDMAREDFFGDVEFHIDETSAQLIEVNIGQPGHMGLIEILEREFLDAFPIAEAVRVNETFEREIVRAVTRDGAHGEIAIAVNHTEASRKYLPHYRYFEQIFERFGARARVVFARDVEVDADGWPTWDGIRYDRVFTLVIPRVWQDHTDEFGAYTEAWRRRPDAFFVNPNAWKTASKRMLPLCHGIEPGSFGLDAREAEAIRSVAIESAMLSEFDSVDDVIERFGDLRNVVAKRLDNYHGKGLLMRPSREQLEQALAGDPEGYVVQRFAQAGTIPCIARDGSVNNYLFSLRMGFLNGEFLGMRGYNYTLPSSTEDLVPVIVV